VNNWAIKSFISAVTQWAETQPDVTAVVLVGSHARGEATPQSDVDLVVLTQDPDRYVADTAWARSFGEVEREEQEDWGRVMAVRVWYAGGREVEFGFTKPDWAALPLDPGTKRVIEDGMRVLFDRNGPFDSFEY